MRSALYARVSTTKQEEANQVNALREYAKAQGWQIDERFVLSDETSGVTGHQEQFGLMMKAARQREFDVLLFWSWDRITRKGVKATFDIMASFESAGIAWYPLQEPFLSSQSDPHLRELLLAIIGWVAKQESVRRSDRIKAWHAEKAREGKPHSRRKGDRDKKPRHRRWRKKPALLGSPPNDQP